VAGEVLLDKSSSQAKKSIVSGNRNALFDNVLCSHPLVKLNRMTRDIKALVSENGESQQFTDRKLQPNCHY
jgi:hypothetical protein